MSKIELKKDHVTKMAWLLVDGQEAVHMSFEFWEEVKHGRAWYNALISELKKRKWRM